MRTHNFRFVSLFTNDKINICSLLPNGWIAAIAAVAVNNAIRQYQYAVCVRIWGDDGIWFTETQCNQDIYAYDANEQICLENNIVLAIGGEYLHFVITYHARSHQ